MRIAVLIVIIVSGFVGGFAQKAAPSSGNWRVLAPANEEFTVEVPLELSYSDDKSEDSFLRGNEDAFTRQYRNRLKDTYFFIFSESRPYDYSPIKSGLDFIRKFDEKGNAVSVGRFEGSKFVFGDNEGFYHTAVFIKTKARTYLFHTVSEDRSSSAADRFISSLKIQEKEPSELKAPTPKTVSATPADDVNQAGSTGPGTGSGIGLGRGSGTGSGPGGPAPTDPSTHNVKIRSKPRASYTDAARFYNVQGTIMLRVTFLADGTIGEVTPISRLPFGLTNQALAAARTIKFEPARKEGIAYSRTMTIHYGFTIW